MYFMNDATELPKKKQDRKSKTENKAQTHTLIEQPKLYNRIFGWKNSRQKLNKGIVLLNNKHPKNISRKIIMHLIVVLKYVRI